MREVNDEEARNAQGSSKPSGHLRISAPAGFGRRHVAPLVPEFIAAYPDVTITLDLSDRLVDLIAERYDWAIRLGELNDSQIVGLRLTDNTRVIEIGRAACRGRCGQYV